MTDAAETAKRLVELNDGRKTILASWIGGESVERGVEILERGGIPCFETPEEDVNGVDPYAAVTGLLRKPYNPKDWGDLEGVSLEPLHAGANEVAGHTVSIRAQQHSDISVAYRVDDAFVLATDTRPDPETAAFAEGVGVLFHEAWYNDADPKTRLAPPQLLPGYASHSEAAAVARFLGSF